MGSLSRNFAVFLILVTAISSIIILKSVDAQTSTPLPTPSIPRFTAKFIDASYNVPTTNSVNPYTGKNETNQGYHAENKTIQLTIDNRPYAPYLESTSATLFFNVREKGFFVNNWTKVYTANTGYLGHSNSDYTVVSYRLSDFPFDDELSNGGQVDFQVQALFGGIWRIDSHFSSGDEFRGVASDWSKTQTVTIPMNSSSPTPTPNPTVPELSWLVIVPLLIAALFIAVKLRHRKTSNLDSRPFLKLACTPPSIIAKPTSNKNLKNNSVKYNELKIQ